MVKHLKCLAAVLSFSLMTSTAVFMSSAEENEASIEQVYVNLPEVTVYETGIQEPVAEAYLGSEKLTLSAENMFSQTGEPIYYYMLLDVSNSMPEQYFDKIKSSIMAFENTIGPNDKMFLYTFGERVLLRLDENHTPENTAAVMAEIDNIDDRTLLFEAISQAADKAEQVPANICKRRVIAVISDGEDFTVGMTGVQEAQENLTKKGIPVYAFGIEDTARENINNFGEFARKSGGSLTVFGDQQADMILDTFHQKLANYKVYSFVSDNNIISNSMEAFTLKTEANRTYTRNVLESRHIPDQAAPVILRTEMTADDQLELEYSEPVMGAETTANYTVSYTVKEEEKKASVVGISTIQDKENTVLITFSSDLQPGDYRVSVVNITDISMEKNQVVNTAEFTVAQYSMKTKILHAVQKWYWTVIVFVIVVLILIIWCVYRKVKKGKGVIYVDGKPVMASDVEIHKHVSIEEQEGMPFWLRVSIKGNQPEELALKMNDSFIVGRSKISNLFFDDKRMSRQHFALEWDGTAMYITDLNTTNGTAVNGVKINKRRQLKQDDRIAAGSVEMVIRW